MLVRAATAADVPAMLEIYRPLVEQTAISFEIEPPGASQFAERLAHYSAGWAWLVCEEEGDLLGYAYGSPHRERLAYRWTTETSAYVATHARRRGVGRLLYLALFDALSRRGYCNALAGIALPNEASIALHQAVGFKLAGIFPSVGYKLGRWHDVAWFHRALIDPLPPDAPTL